jgi:hypothetical protein
LLRTISRRYSSIYASAFTENSAVNNETGWYAAISFHASASVRIDAYADVFYFPWLKYRVDAPSGGRDFLVQFNWQPNKRLQLLGRWKSESKEQDDASIVSPLQELSAFKKINFRTQLNWEVSRRFKLSERLETSGYSQGVRTSRGFLLYNECRFHPYRRLFDCWARILFFQTDSYDARIYTLERDVQYGFSVPAYSGKGMHYAFDLHYDLRNFLKEKFRFKRSLDIWFNWSQTIYANDSLMPEPGVQNTRKNQSTVLLQIITSS